MPLNNVCDKLVLRELGGFKSRQFLRKPALPLISNSTTNTANNTQQKRSLELHRKNPNRNVFFPTILPRCIFPLPTILEKNHDFQRGCVLLGFCSDGNHLIGYRCMVDESVDVDEEGVISISLIPRCKYSLIWWHWDGSINNHMKKVVEIPIFRDPKSSFGTVSTAALRIIVTESSDQRVVIVHGYQVNRDSGSDSVEERNPKEVPIWENFVTVLRNPLEKDSKGLYAYQRELFNNNIHSDRIPPESPQPRSEWDLNDSEDESNDFFSEPEDDQYKSFDSWNTDFEAVGTLPNPRGWLVFLPISNCIVINMGTIIKTLFIRVEEDPANVNIDAENKGEEELSSSSPTLVTPTTTHSPFFKTTPLTPPKRRQSSLFPILECIFDVESFLVHHLLPPNSNVLDYECILVSSVDDHCVVVVLMALHYPKGELMDKTTTSGVVFKLDTQNGSVQEIMTPFPTTIKSDSPKKDPHHSHLYMYTVNLAANLRTKFAKLSPVHPKQGFTYTHTNQSTLTGHSLPYIIHPIYPIAISGGFVS